MREMREIEPLDFPIPISFLASSRKRGRRTISIDVSLPRELTLITKNTHSVILAQHVSTGKTTPEGCAEGFFPARILSVSRAASGDWLHWDID
jgi:hypothetical protein